MKSSFSKLSVDNEKLHAEWDVAYAHTVGPRRPMSWAGQLPSWEGHLSLSEPCFLCQKIGNCNSDLAEYL